MSVQPISQFPTSYPPNSNKNDRNRSNSYDYSQNKRKRTESISGRLRTASDLEELGLINSFEKGRIKDLIISQDETLALHMDNYEKGNKEGLINFLKTSLGGQSIDLIDGLDFDFMQNLNTLLPTTGSFDDFKYLLNDAHGTNSISARDQHDFDQRLRRGSLDSFISDFPLDDLFPLPTNLPPQPPAVHNTHSIHPPQAHHTQSTHHQSSLPHSNIHHHSNIHSNIHSSSIPPYPLSHNSLAHSSHPPPRNSTTHSTSHHHHSSSVDHYGMNNSQYGSSSSQYNTSGNINYAPSSSSTHKSQKKSLRGGINEASDRVELSAYATYAAHLQNSDNKSKNLHKNMTSKHDINNIYPSSTLHNSSSSHSLPSQSSKHDLSSSNVLNSHHHLSSVSNSSTSSSSLGSSSSSSLPISSTSSSSINSLSTPQSIGIDPSLLPPDTPQRLPGYIGAYDPEQRKLRIEKFLEKRQQRVWARKVKYDVRKNFADSRLRIKGRFVKKEDEDVMRELMSL